MTKRFAITRRAFDDEREEHARGFGPAARGARASPGDTVSKKLLPRRCVDVCDLWTRVLDSDT